MCKYSFQVQGDRKSRPKSTAGVVENLQAAARHGVEDIFVSLLWWQKVTEERLWANRRPQSMCKLTDAASEWRLGGVRLFGQFSAHCKEKVWKHPKFRISASAFSFSF